MQSAKVNPPKAIYKTLQSAKVNKKAIYRTLQSAKGPRFSNKKLEITAPYTQFRSQSEILNIVLCFSCTIETIKTRSEIVTVEKID